MASATHKLLIARCKDAIDKLHGDTSVSQETTLRDLRDVRDHLDVVIDGLQSTMKEDGDGEEGA